MSFTHSHIIRVNLEALKAALPYRDGQQLEAHLVERIKEYRGFGGVNPMLYNPGTTEDWVKQGAKAADLQSFGPANDLHNFLKRHLDNEQYNKAVNSLRESISTAFYTPKFLPASIYKILSQSKIFPEKIIDPCAGSGIFIEQALASLPSLSHITAIEKDILSGYILQAIAGNWAVPSNVHICGFEEIRPTPSNHHDIIIGNIPFGNFSVYDPMFLKGALTNRIHNYFFAKGIEHIRDGGLLIFLTTDNFLNSPSNAEVREHLFGQADFVALAVMPYNLMEASSGTNAGTHLLVLQKNSNKRELSDDELLLINSQERQNDFGTYNLNSYLDKHPELYTGDIRKAGKNSYGQAAEIVWQTGSIEDITGTLENILAQQISQRFSRQTWEKTKLATTTLGNNNRKTLDFMEIPSAPAPAAPLQLGLFDIAPAQENWKALAYLNDKDLNIVESSSVSTVAVIRTTDRPDHDSIVLLRAQTKSRRLFLYRIFSNIKPLRTSQSWQSGEQVIQAIKAITKELANFDHEFIFQGERPFGDAFELLSAPRQYYTNLRRFYKEGTLVATGDGFGMLQKIDHTGEKAELSPVLVADKDKAILTQYCIVRDLYHELFESEKNSKVANNTGRKKLNAAYDKFVEAHGHINQSSNRKLVLQDVGMGFLTLSAIERRTAEGFIKSDLFTGPVAQHLKERPVLNDPIEALSASLQEYGHVNLDFISKSCNCTQEYCIDALKGKIFKVPFSDEWETAARYLSGNVVAKLREAENASLQAPDDQHIQDSLQAISLVQPEFIPFELLDFNFGERWIPISYYQQFATEIFETETEVVYLVSVDTFNVIPKQKNGKITEEYAIKTTDGQVMYGQTLLEHALENTTPHFTKTITIHGEDQKVPDHEANVLAAQKIESIRERFIEWMARLSVDQKSDIEKIYNETYNTNVLRAYDGSHLTFPGIDLNNLKIPGIRDSQRNAVWRILQEQGGLIDHEMGLGKTLIAIIASFEMKRLGLVDKPMIIGIKDTVPLIAETYRNAYPNARLLYPGKNDFTPKKRQRIFHQIKHNDWDCIILTHDQFLKIEQSLRIQREIMETELEHLKLDLETVERLGGAVSKKMRKGLITRQSNLTVHLKHIKDRMDNRKDQGIDFEDMGIGHVFIDESHQFKNLLFTTRHNRVAGLGNAAGSQKALNLLFAIRTLQARYNKDQCVTFLSGTPISNSLTELYLIFKYLRPKQLEKTHISNFDAWASVFARKTTDYEFSVTGQIKAKERFRYFIKVPELARLYNEIADYKTAAHIQLDRPELEEKLVNIPPTPDQEDFIIKLMRFAETGDGRLVGLHKLSKQEDTARMLLATNLAQKMSVDIRLIDPDRYADHPGNKVNIAANNIAKYYHLTTAHKGTQLVFCDIGTPKTDEFNVYDALKEALITKHGVPASEISFVHDWPDTQKLLYEKKVNDGLIRIVLGSTPKLGTGRNVQQRLVAVHHMDIPWRPTDLDQRDGRIRRPGNLIARKFYNNKVFSFIYAVEKSLDAYKFNLLKNKITFIAQMKNAELHVRSIDEGSLDEQSGVSFAEYVAILSGDTCLLEKAKVEKRIMQLQTLRTAFNREVSNSRFELTFEQGTQKRLLEKISAYKIDQDLFSRNQVHDRQGNRINNIELPNGLTEPEAVGRYLHQIFEKFRPERHVNGQQKIGTQCGFELYISEGSAAPGIKSLGFNQRSFFVQSPITHQRYTYNRGQIDPESPKLSSRIFLFSLDRIKELIQISEKELLHVQDKITVFEKMISRTFEYESELNELKAKLEELNKTIAVSIEENKREITDSNPTDTDVQLVIPEANNENVEYQLAEPQQKVAPPLQLLPSNRQRKIIQNSGTHPRKGFN